MLITQVPFEKVLREILLQRACLKKSPFSRVCHGRSLESMENTLRKSFLEGDKAARPEMQRAVCTPSVQTALCFCRMFPDDVR